MERRRVPDVVHRALLVVQAQQQRTERGAVARFAPADDNAIGGALVLDLHPVSFARNVDPVPRFRDHAVEACALETVEPLLRRFRIPRAWPQEYPFLDPLHQFLPPLAPLTPRL